MIASAENAADSGAVTTSSPAPIPSARSASAIASVPVPTPRARARGGPGPPPDRVRRPRRARERVLEHVELGTEDEPAAADDAGDRRLDVWAILLRAQLEERHAADRFRRHAAGARGG
jgi:hypothetical protein